MKLFNYLSVLFFSISVSAQNSLCHLNFDYQNTGSNMTFVIQNSAISSLSHLGDGLMGVFFYDENQNLVCAGSTELNGSETVFPLMGNDYTTDFIDGLLEGQELLVLFENYLGDQFFLTPHPSQNFNTNQINYVDEFEIELFCSSETNEAQEVFGCTDLNACNYDIEASYNNGSCEYFVEENSYDLSISPANWGGDTFDSGYSNVVSIDESNDLGCHDYDFEFGGAIALIKRGDCQFSLKALNAQNAGASAVIIYNHNNGNGMMNMGEGSYSDDVHIPVYSMSGHDGHLLSQWIEDYSFDYQAFIEAHYLHIFIESVDCDGNSPNNEEDIFGCMDNSACNFNDQASQEDDCYYPEENFDCNGDCLLDENFDGLCDLDQIFNSQCLPLDYNYQNTGSNMTFALTNSSLTSIESLGEGYLGAFFTNYQNELVCAGSSFINGNETAFPIMGDDVTTDNIDGMESQNLYLIFTALNGSQYQLNPIPNQVFEINEIFYVSSFDIEMIQCGDILGCMDDLANNFDEMANAEDGSCIYYDFNCGCTDDNFIEYFTQGYLANCDNGTCLISVQTNGLSAGHFNTPLNTSNNMTLGLDLSNIYLPNETIIGVFYDLNGDGQINDTPSISSSNEVFFECVGLAHFEDNFTAVAIWGDDALTDELDGLPDEAMDVLFAFLLPNDSVVMFDFTPSSFSFSTNGLLTSDSVNLDIILKGCTDPIFCNFNQFAELDDGSCSGSYGCMDPIYIEYNSQSFCHSPDLCQDTWQDEMTIMVNEFENIMSENSALLDSVNLLSNQIISIDNDLLISNSIIDNNQIQMAQMINIIDTLSTSLNQTELNIIQLNDTITYMAEEIVSMQYELDSTSQLIITSQANEILIYSLVDDMTNQMLFANETITEITSVVDNLNMNNSELSNELSLSLTENANLFQQIDSLEIILENAILSENNSSPIIEIDLLSGWNIIGYTLPFPQDAAASFDLISDILSVVKDNLGQVYWPEFGYNGIGELIPGLGYQILVQDAYEEFVFDNSNGLRINLTPTIPQWAIDMEVPVHPNDVRTLVRVVNYLGQEVIFENEFKGALLYKLFNDGTVEKIIKQ